MTELQYLVLGTGRCGTVYLARLLTSLGLPCGHERVFVGRDIDSSLEAMRREIPNSACSTACGHDLAQYSAGDIIAESSYLAVPFLDDDRLRACRVIHVIRHPVRVLLSFLNDISFFRHKSAQDVTHSHERFVYEHLPSLQMYDSPVLRACHYYIEWNRMIEKSAKDRDYLFFPVEDDPQRLFGFLGVCPLDDYFRETTCNTYRRWPDHLKPQASEGFYTAEDVFRCSLAPELIRLAERYGYRNIEQETYEAARREDRHRRPDCSSTNAGHRVNPTVPRLVEKGYCGFNIVAFGHKFYALAQKVGPINVAQLTADETHDLVGKGLCLVGDSRQCVKLQVAAYHSGAVETVSNQGCHALVIDTCWSGLDVVDGGADEAWRTRRTAA